MFAKTALGCTATQIRVLFAIMLTTCFSRRVDTLCDKHNDSMTGDILDPIRTLYNDLTITFSDPTYNKALIAIEDLCVVIANLPLNHFDMRLPN